MRSLIAVLIGHADQQQEPRTDLLKVERGIQIPQLIDDIDRRCDTRCNTTFMYRILSHPPPPHPNWAYHGIYPPNPISANEHAIMPRPPKLAGTVDSGEQGTSPKPRGVSGPGGKNEATGDNIRKDGTDATMPTANPRSSIPLHSPTGAARTAALRALGDPAGL